LNILIYHHDDNDGFLSAAVASIALLEDLKFEVGHYDGTHNVAAIEEADYIYVLDYTLPDDLMEKYSNKIIWIDHHVSSIERLGRLGLRGKTQIGKSGCLLTWEYFYPNLNPPLVVQIVNDRDVWKWEMGERTAAFHEASRMFMSNVERWKELINDDALTSHYITQGYEILRFIRNIVDIYNNNFAWEGEFEGYPAVFLNGSGIISGELHKRLREAHPKAEIAVVFMFQKDQVNVGLYRADWSDVDLSLIAGKYGGGGHAGASGFFITHAEWIKLIKE